MTERLHQARHAAPSRLAQLVRKRTRALPGAAGAAAIHSALALAALPGECGEHAEGNPVAE